jgi:carnitine-CoA ligase
MVSNCPEFLYAWFGLMKIGAILVPMNSAFRQTETQYIVQHAAAAAIVVDAATPQLRVAQWTWAAKKAI